MNSKIAPAEIMGEDAAKYRAGVRDGLAEIDRILRRLNQKQVRIEKLKAETRVILDRLKED